MKKILITILPRKDALMLVGLSLVLLSLACLTTAGVSQIAPSTATNIARAFTPDEIFEPVDFASAVLTSAPRLCVRVIAIEALNVRKGPSENDIVLTWLKSGDVVQVIDQSNADWWRIDAHGVSGYARSIYLQIIECS